MLHKSPTNCASLLWVLKSLHTWFLLMPIYVYWGLEIMYRVEWQRFLTVIWQILTIICLFLMVIFTGGIHRTARPAKTKLNKDFNQLNEIFWLFLPLQHVRSWLALTMSFLKSGVVLLSKLRSLTTLLGFCWWSLWLRFSKMCLHLPSPSIYTGKRETPTHNTDLLRLVSLWELFIQMRNHRNAGIFYQFPDMQPWLQAAGFESQHVWWPEGKVNFCQVSFFFIPFLLLGPKGKESS